MSAHKHIDRICLAAVLISLLAALVLCSRGVQSEGAALGYDARLFDTGRVHTIEIVMDDWDGFLETCENEEYAACAVVIDGEAYKNVGIRAKGNTSLSMVSAMDSDRYSFKLEFDHYEAGRSYYGLDKLCLNNIIQDNTYMKDCLTYRLMADFGVDAPLCSYVYITVNGEDWGLYLAAEGVEEGYMQRTGKTRGNLYKPDSLSMGGGRGNGRGFNMDGLDWDEEGAPAFGDFQPGERPDRGMNSPDQPAVPEEGAGNGNSGQPDQPAVPEEGAGNERDFPVPGEMPEPPDFAGGGMGAADVKLQYTDDDPESYANIFESAKTAVTDADEERLIEALKKLGEGDPSALDIEQVLRYFVVHNYVCNGDSYTGSMVHNYYLYEEEGRLSMIPWDYNLAFGTFQAQDAPAMVNDPIDTPLSVTGGGDRPMFDWITGSTAYTELYHQYFAEFLETADPAGLIAEMSELIAPYVEKDPTKFCTYEEFQTGVQTLTEFCRLRTESVAGQLAGTIPADSDGQTAEPSALVDASGLKLSEMGTMNHGGGRSRDAFGPNAGTAPQAEGEDPANSKVPAMNADSGERDGLAAPTAPQAEGEDPANGKVPAMNAVPPTGGIPDRTAFNGAPGGFREETAAGPEALILLGVSAAILLVGILLVKRYRRWGG